MGQLSRHRAKERFRIALNQRLPEDENPTDERMVHQEAIGELLDIAMDSGELDRVTRSFADNPDAIDFPE